MLSITACKKDFLTVQPTDRIATSAVESDTAVFEAFVTNRYIGAKLQDKEGDGSNPGFGRGFEYSMWSSLTDESIYSNDDATWLVQRGQLAPENLGGAGVLWARSYRSIRECNYALSILPNMPLSAGHKTRIEGELKFIRAFRYQDLIRNYGGVVLMGDKVVNLTDNLQDPSLFKRASIKESIDYAAAQLDDAASKLPLNNDGSWLLGRAT
ncbi:MAG TPA: RagB/SusD family nutrient uptake outer membrane protein, partial [Mucilaginibacter sp.]|nr:RagB/SusD family nutrient uptake outer membrane protein [Mucilaginibacter sp.]